jgi:beta-lactamase superfamily II metal-dependent hydrolase
MDLKIFDVEHGACSLLTCDNKTRLMIDCANNASTAWSPGTYLRAQSVNTLEMLAITNYDEDHVRGIADVMDKLDVRWLWRNRSVSARQICSLKSEDGMGDGIARLVDAIENVFTGDGSAQQPAFQGLVRQSFWNGIDTFDDENNLSMVLHLKCHGTGVLFPGDLERAGWRKLLEREDFRAALHDTKVLVASHHGRESGCCEEIFGSGLCEPFFVVISDQGYTFDTQKTIPFYRRFARGGSFREENERRVLTTRKDGRIGFTFNASGWGPY